MRDPANTGIPRWAALALALLLWLVAIPLVHGVLPWAISRLSPRYGWTNGSPALWNRLGLIPVAVGTGFLLWVMVLGFALFAEWPGRVPLDWSPKLLMTRGPYTVSRHPMYLGELALWLGWAVLYGSIPVLIGFLVMCLGVNVVVPREERALAAQFRAVYTEYNARTPRWFGFPTP